MINIGLMLLSPKPALNKNNQFFSFNPGFQDQDAQIFVAQ